MDRQSDSRQVWLPRSIGKEFDTDDEEFWQHQLKNARIMGVKTA